MFTGDAWRLWRSLTATIINGELACSPSPSCPRSARFWSYLTRRSGIFSRNLQPSHLHFLIDWVYDHPAEPPAHSASPDGSYPNVTIEYPPAKDNLYAQTTWMWDLAERKAMSALQRAASAGSNCGPCSNIVTDISHALYSNIQNSPSKLLAWAIFATIFASTDGTFDSVALKRSLRVSSVLSTAPTSESSRGLCDDDGTLHTDRPRRWTTEVWKERGALGRTSTCWS